MTENQIRPFNLVEVKNSKSSGLALKLSPSEDYLIGNPAEDEFIMFRTTRTNEVGDGVDLQFFQHSNGEYTPLGIHTFLYNIDYKLKDANLYFGVIFNHNANRIIINAPPNVDIIHEKAY